VSKVTTDEPAKVSKETLVEIVEELTRLH